MKGRSRVAFHNWTRQKFCGIFHQMGGFHSHGATPQLAGWFTMENPRKIRRMTRGTAHFRKCPNDFWVNYGYWVESQSAHVGLSRDLVYHSSNFPDGLYNPFHRNLLKSPQQKNYPILFVLGNSDLDFDLIPFRTNLNKKTFEGSTPLIIRSQPGGVIFTKVRLLKSNILFFRFRDLTSILDEHMSIWGKTPMIDFTKESMSLDIQNYTFQVKVWTD